MECGQRRNDIPSKENDTRKARGPWLEGGGGRLQESGVVGDAEVGTLRESPGWDAGRVREHPPWGLQTLSNQPGVEEVGEKCPKGESRATWRNSFVHDRFSDSWDSASCSGTLG